MEVIHLSSKLAVNPDVVYTQIDEDMVMMGPEDGLYYGMNSIGSVIWSLLEASPMTLEALCGRVQEDYNVDREQCLSDTSNFINEMIAQRMVVVLQ